MSSIGLILYVQLTASSTTALLVGPTWEQRLSCSYHEEAGYGPIWRCAIRQDSVGAVENTYPIVEVLEADGDSAIVRRSGEHGSLVFRYSIDEHGEIGRVCHSAIPSAGTPIEQVMGAPKTFVDRCVSFGWPCLGADRGYPQVIWTFEVEGSRLTRPVRSVTSIDGPSKRGGALECAFHTIEVPLLTGTTTELLEGHRGSGTSFLGPRGQITLQLGDKRRVIFRSPSGGPLRVVGVEPDERLETVWTRVLSTAEAYGPGAVVTVVGRTAAIRKGRDWTLFPVDEGRDEDPCVVRLRSGSMTVERASSKCFSDRPRLRLHELD